MSREDSGEALLVFVQGVPGSIPDGVEKFSDLSKGTFLLNHSSKVALTNARNLGKKIFAIGHSSVLAEALTRGADECMPVPLCQDPYDQAVTLPKDKRWINVIIGENPDGPFTGPSLAGVLSELWNWNLIFESSIRERQAAYPSSSIILVKDKADQAFQSDVRRVNRASDQKIATSEVRGTLRIQKRQVRGQNEDLGTNSSEIARYILRRIGRFRQSEI